MTTEIISAMEKGAASPGDTPQQHAYDLHGVG